MSRETFVYRNGEFVEKYGPKDIRPKAPRASFPTPMIINDGLDYVQSMADGKHYTSKRAMRAVYKQKGLVEVGDQAPTQAKAPVVSDPMPDIVNAYKKVKAGYKPKRPAIYSEIE